MAWTAFILGLVVLIKDKGGKGLAIAALVLSFLSPVLAGIPAAIAIPNFIKFQSRAKQAECKANLKALYTAEKSYFQQNERYSEDPAEIGFAPDGTRRYSYFLSELDATIPANENPVTSTDELPDLGDLPLGVDGECPACEFTAVCAGNIDSDADLDVWAISTLDQRENGEPIPAGTPYQLADDVAL